MKRFLFFTHNIFALENPEGYRTHQYFQHLKKIGFAVELLATKETVTDVLVVPGLPMWSICKGFSLIPSSFPC
jgi:hypothetical protein